MTGYFAALPGGAVYEDTERCECGGDPCVEWTCGKHLIGWLPQDEIPYRDTALSPSVLWDFSGVDYTCGWHIRSVDV